MLALLQASLQLLGVPGQSSQAFSLSVCWVHIPSPHKDTSPVASGPSQLGFDHILPSLGTASVTLFPNEITVGGTGGQHTNIGILGDAVQPLTPAARNSTISTSFLRTMCTAGVTIVLA